jgi:pentatricopeptide repeat protein
MSDESAASGQPLRQICFMIMPYGKKPTDVELGKGPAVVDFNALWDKVYLPLIEEDLDCVPIRADQDMGALIIAEMIHRLALSDLVMADITAPNPNVYYEVGVRQTAKERGCVLISAEWSKQGFDLAQMRQLRYPLPEGEITDQTAAAVRDALRDPVKKARDGISPIFEAIPGFPNPDLKHIKTLQEQADALSHFSAEVREARLRSGAEVVKAAHAVWDRYRKNVGWMPVVAMEVLYLLRDAKDWQGVIQLVDSLEDTVKRMPVVTEQYWLAKSKLGDHQKAIAALEELIKAAGDTSERRGLIGGRYKKLYDAATTPVDKARYLGQAIDNYQRGMLLDLNDYYPSSNLPRLLRLRGRPGDEDRASAAAAVTMLACQRALARNPADEWIRPTLLGAAFDAGDVTEATRLYDEMLENGIAAFHLDTTLADLERTVNGMANGEKKTQLAALLDQLRALLPAPGGV